MKKRILSCIFLAGIVSSLAIGSTVILANANDSEINKAAALANDGNSENQTQAPTLEIMAEKAKTDSTLLETLDRFSDDDQVIAYPENLGGGFSVKAPDSQPLVGEILDSKGDKVIYRDDQPVTIAQVKEAIQKNQ